MQSRWLAAGGIAGPVIFAAAVVVLGAHRDGYSHTRQYISELGETGAADAGYLTAALLLLALGLASLAAPLPSYLGVGRWATVAAGLILASAFCIAVAGGLRCDPGCPVPGDSWHGRLHHVANIGSVLALLLAPFVISRIVRLRSSLGLVSLILGAAVAGTAVLTLAFVVFLDDWKGLAQRVSLGIALTWLAYVAGNVLLARRP